MHGTAEGVERIDWFLLSPPGEPVRLIAAFKTSAKIIRVRVFATVGEGLAYAALAGVTLAHRELKY